MLLAGSLSEVCAGPVEHTRSYLVSAVHANILDD